MFTETFRYGEDHILQTVTVTTLQPAAPFRTSYWVMYAHNHKLS